MGVKAVQELHDLLFHAVRSGDGELGDYIQLPMVRAVAEFASPMAPVLLEC
jgi:hypothetical protein